MTMSCATRSISWVTASTSGIRSCNTSRTGTRNKGHEQRPPFPRPCRSLVLSLFSVSGLSLVHVPCPCRVACACGPSCACPCPLSLVLVPCPWSLSRPCPFSLVPCPSSLPCPLSLVPDYDPFHAAFPRRILLSALRAACSHPPGTDGWRPRAAAVDCCRQRRRA